MNYKPYVSLDIETTGLNEADHVLQVGMIYDDLKSPVESLERVAFLVDSSSRLYSHFLDYEALSMNGWAFDMLSGKTKAKYPILPIETAIKHFQDTLVSFASRQKGAIVFAGKNVGTFDMKLLRSNDFLNEPLLAQRGVQISHRTLDIGALYFPDFGYVPTSGEINQLIGRKPVTHDALNDALDVVCAIRTKIKMAI